MTYRKLTGLAVAIVVAAGTHLMAQGVTAQVGGQVTSTAGAVLPEATVVIRNAETGFIRTTKTDANGRFIATMLPVGPYSVSVVKGGYQSVSNLKLTLKLGDAAPLNLKLAPESGATVEIVASVAPVDSERANAQTLISTESLVNLPVNGRKFSDLASIAPQVAIDSSRGSVAIAGQRGVNSSINIDGGDYNDPFFGGANGSSDSGNPYTISMEAVREFQVITNGASAEFGHMGGGYLNAVTKSGTNDFTGGLFYYLRNQNMKAKIPNLSGVPGANDVTDFKIVQYGGSVGGPIIKDKLFYFITFDAQRRTDPIKFNWGGTNPDPTFPIAGDPADAVLLSKVGNYKTMNDATTVFAKFSYLVNLYHTVELRYNHSKYNGMYSAGSNTAIENTTTNDVLTDSMVLEWNWTINSVWFNQARFNYVTDDMPRESSTTTPRVAISGKGGGYYGRNMYGREFTTKRYEWQDNISFMTPTLQVKAGFDYMINKINEVFQPASYGSYSFSSLANFRLGKWTSFQQMFGLGGLSASEAGTLDVEDKQTTLFVQADWRPMDSVKVGLGVRWDRQEHGNDPILDFSNPMAAKMPLTRTIPTDSQISPRFSFIWTPAFDKGKTVVRASAGSYVSSTPAVFMYSAIVQNGYRSGTYTITGGPQGASQPLPYGTGATGFNWANPAVLTAPPNLAASGSVATTYSPDFKNPRTESCNLGVDRGFGSWVLGFSADYSRGYHLERLIDLNLGTPTLVNGRLIFPNTGGTSPKPIRPNTNYAALLVYASDAESRYQAMTLSAKYHKDGSPFEAQFFYTYSKNRDNDSNERNYGGVQAQNVQRLQDEWSWADTDRRHVVTGSATYLEHFSKILIGLTGHYTTGTPSSLNSANDLNNDAIYFDRLLGTERNGFRQCSNMYFDMKLSREWAFARRARFTLSADVFNILNRKDTYTYQVFPGNDAAPGVYSKTGYTGSPRQAQLGARFSF